MPTFSGEVATAATDTADTVSTNSVLICERIQELWGCTMMNAHVVFSVLQSAHVWGTHSAYDHPMRSAASSLAPLRGDDVSHSEAMAASHEIIDLVKVFGLSIHA